LHLNDVRPPAALFESLRRGGRCTQLVGIRRAWDPHDPMLEATRAAARRGLAIERLFLLAHRRQQRDPRLVEQRKLDHDAGIATRVLHAGPHVVALADAAPGGFEMGLWDDAVCGVFETGQGDDADRIVAWRERRDAASLARARAFLDAVDARVPPAGDEPADDLPEDPVLLVAPVVEASAPHCHVDPETGRSCPGFHLPRTYFRIFGTMGGTWAQRELYERGLAPLLREGARPRILVPATADHSLYALLLWLARRAGAEPAFVASDLCPTPLAATRWYAGQEAARVETVAADAVGFAEHGPFDAICAHLFYGWVRPDRRVPLLESWAALLRPGGRVVTNVSVVVGDDPEAFQRFRPGQIERFAETAVARARACKDFVGVDPGAIEAMARDYLPSWRSRFPRMRLPEVEATFDAAGFDLEVELRERTPLLPRDWDPHPERSEDRAPHPDRKEAWLVAVRRG